MNCYVCSKSDWHKIPGLHSRSIIQICKGCGALCHDVTPERDKRMFDYYKTEFRKAPNHSNLVTTTNKLQYILKFLGPWLEGKKGLVCGDVGAATGYVLQWLRSQGHRVTGSEYAIAFRRMSEHFYGIPLTEELEPKHKYDLIILYHVLEHMSEPDKKLEKYRDMLSENGILYVSTPYYLGELEHQTGNPISGEKYPTGQLAFEELFHKDHVDLFTKECLQNLFRKVGLTVIKDDFTLYGQSYLLKAGNKQDIHPEDWNEVLEKLRKQRHAIELYTEGKFSDAIKVWPDFPEAHIQMVFRTYGKDPDRQQDMLNNLPASMKKHSRVLHAKAQWLMQYERLEEALQVWAESAEFKPTIDAIIRSAECFTRLKRPREAMNAYAKAAELHPYKWAYCYDEILANACSIETWDERGAREAKEILFKDALLKGIVKTENPPLIGANG